jgi:hypothetical protein
VPPPREVDPEFERLLRHIDEIMRRERDTDQE